MKTAKLKKCSQKVKSKEKRLRIRIHHDYVFHWKHLQIYIVTLLIIKVTLYIKKESNNTHKYHAILSLNSFFLLHTTMFLFSIMERKSIKQQDLSTP